MKHKNTLLKKIIVLFISIFIPLTLFSVITVKQDNLKFKNHVLSSIDANNSNYISQLATSLTNIYTNSFNMINQSNFRNFSALYPSLSPYEKMVEVKLIREQLSGICLSSQFVESTHVYFKDLKIAYNSQGYYYGSFNNMTTNEIKLLKKAEQSHKILQYYTDPLSNQERLSFFITSDNSANFTVRIDLSEEELHNYIKENSTYENEDYLMTFENELFLTDLDSKLQPEALALQKELKVRLPEQNYTLVTLNGKNYYVFSYVISGMSLEYLRFIPAKSLLKNIDIAPLFIITFFLFIFGACILFFCAIYRMVHQPLHQLTTAFNEVENGNFKVIIEDYPNNDFSYLFKAFNNMTEKLDNLIERDYHQKMLLQKAELKQLQAQINPHFLYNSFFMLQRMIKMEMMEESQEISNALAVYFRYLTRNSMDQVTLAQEYEHAKTYAYIQGLRFAGRIEIHFEELPLEFSKLPVPKLILQPILENAFNYGLHNKISNGILEIHFSVLDDTLKIIVEENGDELTDEALQTLISKLETVKTDSVDYEMTGILNIQRRLIIFSNRHDSLQVSRSYLGGLCVSITLDKNITEVR